MMLEKNAFMNTIKDFAYRIRNCRNSAIHLGGNLVLGETVMGDPIIIDSGHFSSLKLLYLPPPNEIAIMSYLFHFIKPSMHCLDIDAGTGYYSMVLAHLVGLKGQVYSFENDESCYKLLERNRNLNGFSSIIAENTVYNIEQFIETQKNNISFVHISSDSNLPDIYRSIQETVESNQLIHILCHISPEELMKTPQPFEHFFQSLNSEGFEGFLFPLLTPLVSEEQLTVDSSIKSLLLCRGSLWTAEGSEDG